MKFNWPDKIQVIKQTLILFQKLQVPKNRVPVIKKVRQHQILEMN